MVEYIEYKGHKYPIRISYSALKKVQAEAGDDKDVKDLMSGDISICEPMLFQALKSGAFAMDEEMKFKHGEKEEIKEEHMEYMLDECFKDFIKLFPKFFGDFKDMDVEGDLGKYKQTPQKIPPKPKKTK